MKVKKDLNVNVELNDHTANSFMKAQRELCFGTVRTGFIWTVTFTDVPTTVCIDTYFPHCSEVMRGYY